MKEPEKDTVSTYGLLAINHVYNEGKISFSEWLELSREWAFKILEQYGEGADCHPPSCYNIDNVGGSSARSNPGLM